MTEKPLETDITKIKEKIESLRLALKTLSQEVDLIEHTIAFLENNGKEKNNH